MTILELLASTLPKSDHTKTKTITSTNTIIIQRQGQHDTNQSYIFSISNSKMTKSDISYASVPTTSEPYVEGIQVGSHAVTVIVDESTRQGEGRTEKASIIGGSELDSSRLPVTLKMCPHCHVEHARTMTKTYPSVLTWCSVAIGAIVFFPLCWIPLVVDPMKTTDHYCQSCGKQVGQVKALEGCCVKERF
jgi:hypothetical protein